MKTGHPSRSGEASSLENKEAAGVKTLQKPQAWGQQPPALGAAHGCLPASGPVHPVSLMFSRSSPCKEDSWEGN